MIKSRITFNTHETNGGKLRRLSDLYAAYTAYVQECIDQMASGRRSNVFPSERQTYFKPSPVLSSQIEKNARMQAVDLMAVWVKGLYGRKLSKQIARTEGLSDNQKMQLRCCGKYNVSRAGKFGKGTITQEMVDLYWGWVWDESVSGKPPTVSAQIPMMMTEMTCVFGPSKGSEHFGWWLRFSGLESGRRVQVPLVSTPYLNGSFAKTVLVQPSRDGRWRFQFSEEVPDKALDGSKGKVGLDVGLNCLAATSDGRIYGPNFKPLFDKTYTKVRTLRANRQRQGLKENSRRLSKLETRLSGQAKTTTGTAANKLVKAFPDHTFVVEDLDLRGCKGQKRFAYRALHKNLASKAVCEVVNPAYTSQMCPSCGCISRGNRKGINFCCTSCGRKAHADWVGSYNLLGRSEDKQIGAGDHPSVVKRLLVSRYLARRKAAKSSVPTTVPHRGRQRAPVPSGRNLTTGGPQKATGTGSKTVVLRIT